MTLKRVFPKNKQILRRIQETIMPKESEQYIVNRNPRNLESLRIAHKNKGYELDQRYSKNAGFWHKYDNEI
jgi:large subunit ribosomal protein L18